MSTIEGIDSAGTASLPFLEELFDQYQSDPASVPPDWRAYFDALGGAVAAAPPAANGHAVNGHGSPTSGGPAVAKLVTPDGIATGHAVAIAKGDVRLPAAPAGEAMPLPLPPVASGTKGEERVAFLQDRVAVDSDRDLETAPPALA